MSQTIALISPLNSATGVASRPQLTWNKINGATSYILTVFQDTSGYVTILSLDVGNVSLFDMPMSIYGSYKWNIQSIGSESGNSIASETWSFTVPFSIALISPTNGATGVAVSPTFTWSSVVGANSYRLQVFGSGGGSAVFDQDVGNVTSYSIQTALYPSSNHAWKVTAVGIDGGGSDTWSFVVVPFITRTSPSDYAIISSDSCQFTWLASAGATGYRLKIYDEAEGYESTGIFNQVVGNVTSYVVSGVFFYGKTYRWQVTAVNTGAVSYATGVFYTVAVFDVVSPIHGQVITNTMTMQITPNIAIIGVKFQIDYVDVGNEILNTPYSCIMDTNILFNGFHRCVVDARYMLRGTQYIETKTVELWVNNSVTSTPVVIINSPDDSQEIKNIFNIEASITDNAILSNVEFKIDDNNVSIQANEPLYTCLLDTNQLPNGQHVLTVIAENAANSTTSQRTFTISNPVIQELDRKMPAVSITSPTSGTTIHGIFVLKATVPSDVQVVGVQFMINDEKINPTIQIAPYSLTIDTALYGDGDYKISAVVIDALGNRSAESQVLVTIDNTTSHAPLLLSGFEIIASGVYYSINNKGFVLFDGNPVNVNPGDKVTAFTAMELEDYRGILYSDNVTVTYTEGTQQNAMFDLTNVNARVDNVSGSISVSWDNQNTNKKVRIYYGTDGYSYLDGGLALSPGGTPCSSPIETNSNNVKLYGAVSGVPYWIKVAPADVDGNEGTATSTGSNVTVVNGIIPQIAKSITIGNAPKATVDKATGQVTIALE